MIHLLALLIALFSTMPILTLFFFMAIFRITMAKRRAAFGLAIDITTLFAVLSAAALALHIWHRTLFGPILLIILFVAFIFTIISWRKKDDFKVKRLFRGIWRLNFLVFMVLDSFLYIYGLMIEGLHRI
ncbi:uncharacterized protein DUF3397 [Scopulibacillus darangshiensis]|uniref:Uncharacterized protein DUF3397 n=1 Tax=Scopulibacillus darangshiensis TaxID=442528 RepID=A0A4R2P2Z2_9BACL|nr:DUF3397 domain-containing protein [Scopulibacillus darangshiensis]TCP29080.1 uncharacterized protein DUF3397 [Scopulibacillus darangshiensis]